MKEPVQTLGFDVLTSYHKAEASEELTYLSILITVAVGIIGYLGAAPRVSLLARLLLLAIYVVIHQAMMGSLLATIKIHSAIHQEIKDYVLANSNKFIGGVDSALYQALVEGMKPHPLLSMELGSQVFMLIMAFVILFVGKNSLYEYLRGIIKRPGKKASPSRGVVDLRIDYLRQHLRQLELALTKLQSMKNEEWQELREQFVAVQAQIDKAGSLKEVNDK